MESVGSSVEILLLVFSFLRSSLAVQTTAIAGVYVAVGLSVKRLLLVFTF